MINSGWVCNPASGEHYNCGHAPTVRVGVDLAGEGTHSKSVESVVKKLKKKSNEANV